MLEVTVKTLDGKNLTFSVPDEITVREFKEKIASSIEIPVERQRLIYHGRVLQDDKKLNDYDVHEKTMHVVERVPPGVRAQAAASTGETERTRRRPRQQGGGHFMSAIQQAINRGMGEAGRNAQVSTTQSADGHSLDVHINLGQIGEVQSEPQRRIDTARRMIQRATRTIQRLERGPRQQRETNATQNTEGASGTAQIETEDSDMETEQSNADEGLDGGSDAPQVVAMVEEITEIQMEAQVHISGDSEEEEVGELGEQREVDSARTDAHDDSMADSTAAPDTTSPSAMDSGNQAQVSGSAAEDVSGSDARPEQAEAGTQTNTQTTSTTQTDATNTTATGTQTEGTSPIQHPSAAALADLMAEVMTLNSRLQPHLERYTELMRNDPDFGENREEAGRQQRFFNLTSEALHYVSHAYHAISDLMLDLRRPPPRLLRAGPTPRPTIIQQTIPVQASVNVQQIPVGVRGPVPTTQPATPATSAAAAPASTPGSQPTTASSQARSFNVHSFGPFGIRSTSAQAGTTAQPGATQTPPFPTGLPPFMDPTMFQNMMRMATTGANVAPGAGPRVRSEVFVVTQPGGTPVRVTPPANATAGARPATSQTSSPPRAGQNQPGPAQQNQPRPLRWTVSGGHVRPAASNNPGTQGGARPRGVAMPGPPPPPGAGLLPAGLGLPPGLNLPSCVDPFLPCHSRHFLARRAVAAARQANQQRGNSEQQAGVEAEANTIASVVSNIVGGLLNPPTSMPDASAPRETTTSTSNQPAGANPSTTNPFAALFSGNTHTPLPTGGQVAANASNFMQQLNSVLAQSPGQPVTSTAPTASGSQSAAPGRGQSPDSSGPLMAELMRGVVSGVMQASATGQNQGTIADFLQQLGEQYNVTDSNEGFLNGVFHCMSQNMGFADLMQIFFGNPQPLENVRAPLQEFLRERVLSGESATVENLERGVSRVVTDLSDQFENATNGLQTLDDVDFESTLSTFFEHNLTSLVTFVMNSNETAGTFGADLYGRVRRAIHEFIVLGDHCLGPEAFNQFLEARINDFMGDINPGILASMRSMTMAQLQDVRRNVTLSHSDVAQYVIKKSTHKMDTSSQKSHSSENDEPFMSADEGDAPPPRNKARDVTSCPGSGQATEPSSSPTAACGPDDIAQSPGSRGVPFPLQTENGCWHDCGDEYSATRHAPPATEMALHTSRCARAPANEKPPPEVTVGSEPWHGVVPREWVPVISRDIETQQQQQSRPLSDAYISGMPCKRRKVIHENRPDSSAFAHPENSLPEAMTQTAAAMGIQPITSPEQLSRDLRADESLHAAFHSRVRDDVRNRCKDEKDLVPRKYQNTEKYFGNKK